MEFVFDGVMYFGDDFVTRWLGLISTFGRLEYLRDAAVPQLLVLPLRPAFQGYYAPRLNDNGQTEPVVSVCYFAVL